MKFIVLAALLLVAFFGCTDTFEVHEKYIDGGEIIYTSKVTNLVALSGNKRIKIIGTITNAYSVNEILVTWNNQQDSKTFLYTNSEKVTDTLELIIDNLEEKSYQFQVISKNSGGKKSVAARVFGNVYGNIFQATLSARKVNSTSYNIATQTGYANLGLPYNLTRNTQVKYTNSNGNEAVAEDMVDNSQIALPQIDLTKPISYRTFYVPSPKDALGNETSLDTFVSDWKIFTPDVSIGPVIMSFTFDSILGGVVAKWNNANNLDLTFNFSSTDINGVAIEKSVSSSKTTDTFTISNLAEEEQQITILVSGLSGNEWINTFTVSPIIPVLVDKTNWSIANVSSKEPSKSTIEFPNNGLGEALIDGNVNTFWHTATANTQPSYPHLITIDLGEIKTISSVKLFRKRGDNGGAKVHSIFTSNAPSSGYKIAATYNGNLETDEGLSIKFSPVATRYITYRVSQGNNYYTHLAELNAYSID
jgi:hypothetical protein